MSSKIAAGTSLRPSALLINILSDALASCLECPDLDPIIFVEESLRFKKRVKLVFYRFLENCGKCRNNRDRLKVRRVISRATFVDKNYSFFFFGMMETRPCTKRCLLSVLQVLVRTAILLSTL